MCMWGWRDTNLCGERLEGFEHARDGALHVANHWLAR